MADDPNAPPIDPTTTGAAPAPGSPQGQADGSPPAEAAPTSGGNETEKEKDLRRKITEQAEELAWKERCRKHQPKVFVDEFPEKRIFASFDSV